MMNSLCKHDLDDKFPFKCKRCGLDINDAIDLIMPKVIESLNKEKGEL